MEQATYREKISRALSRRPDPADHRQYLFWLVDVIYACKATKDADLMEKASLLEDSLGHFQTFLEHGAAEELHKLRAKMKQFADFIAMPTGPSSAQAAGSSSASAQAR